MIPPPPLEQPNAKAVRWKDHNVHKKRGHSSFLDLETSSVASWVEQDSSGRITEREMLWYSELDFNEQRGIVKSEFFRRLGSDAAEDESTTEAAASAWNRLSAYAGHRKKLQPRKYGDDGEDKDEADEGASVASSPSNLSRSDSMSDFGLVERASPAMGHPRAHATPSPTYDEMAGPLLTGPVGLEHFTVHGLVGEGAFGKVMMATKVDTQKVYAMKVMRKEQLFNHGQQSVTQAITEKKVLQTMASRPHPYVVSLR